MQTRTQIITVAAMLMTALPGLAQKQALQPDPGSAAHNASSASAPTPTATDESGFQNRYARYRLRPGDAFDISFELSPEFNQSVSVQPDGYITLRGIGDVHVADETVPELTTTVRSEYSKILHDPLISVVLKDFEKPYFIADGQIGHPGKYELRGATTLTEAVAMAGGFLDSAKHSQVLLFRKASEGWYAARIIDVKKMEKQGNLSEDPELHPGDMLFVPKNSFSKIRPFIPGSTLAGMVKPY